MNDVGVERENIQKLSPCVLVVVHKFPELRKDVVTCIWFERESLQLASGV